MEVPVAHYQNLIPLYFSNQKLFREKSLFSPEKLGKIRCLGLRPRPQLKPEPPKPEIPKKSSLRICSQIEKLVLCGKFRDALDLFEILEMEEGFDVEYNTYDLLVEACIGLRSIRGVKSVYGYMIRNGYELDLYMRNRVLLMHLKCGMMFDARQLFDEMPERNLVTWNVILLGLVDAGDHRDAFRLFLKMWEEDSDGDSRVFTTMITSAASMERYFVGRQLHSCVVKSGLSNDVFVSCSLIDMYGKCGSIEEAQYVFDEMPEKTVVGWNSIIAGYALAGYSEKALSMYHDMQNPGVKMDEFAFSMIMRIYARLASFEHAKQAHAGMIRQGFGSDMVANSALVDFYSKWGKMEHAQRVFDSMPSKNVISWNALIAGYGNHGRGEEALERFEQMLQQRVKPNHVTFLAVLSACSYSGLFERGLEIYQSMRGKVKFRAMHYACMIELLGRKGFLDEAFSVITNAHVKPSANMWAALLTASRVHGNLHLGKLAAEKLVSMEPEKVTNYTVLLNIKKGLENADVVVETMRRKGLKTLPSCSWIEIKKQPHCFLFGDEYHPAVYQKVDSLMEEISRLGFVPGEEETLLPDVEEGEQRVLCRHSEKLALAFGLMNTADWMVLQIVQGHRICNDCHQAFKFIAEVTRREIVVRDGSRFHRFRDGNCSCGDYW